LKIKKIIYLMKIREGMNVTVVVDCGPEMFCTARSLAGSTELQTAGIPQHPPTLLVSSEATESNTILVVNVKLLHIYSAVANVDTEQYLATASSVFGKSKSLDCFGTRLLSKGKAVALQAWSGPEGSRKLRFPDFLRTAQYGGKVVSLTHRPPLPPGNTPGSHFC
jgi:hypothetical protein